MALVREILRSNLKDLTIVGYGGTDMGMLCAAGKVKKLIYGFVSLDFIPLEPFFRKAREANQIEAMELDEGQLHRSEEHTSELQSLMRISYAVFCLNNKKFTQKIHNKC